MNTYSYLSLCLLIPSLLSGAAEVQQPAAQFVFNLYAEAKTGSHPVYEIDGNRVLTSFIDKKVTLLHMNKSFFVREGDKVTPVLSHCIDKELRSKTVDQVAQVLNGSTVTITQRPNGQYVLSCRPQLMGGGIGGAKAGFFFGGLAVRLLGHGFIFVTATIAAIPAAAGGPLAAAGVFSSVTISMEGSMGPHIEAAAKAASIGCGVLGAVATGPV
jgi:hypothetical protein